MWSGSFNLSSLSASLSDSLAKAREELVCKALLPCIRGGSTVG